MVKIKRIIATAMAIVIPTAAIIGCGQGSESKVSKDTEGVSNQAAETVSNGEEIVMGYIAPLTGPASLYGQTALNGVKLAVKIINENGGVLGKQIRLAYEDDKNDPTDAINGFKRLVEKENVQFILGPITSKNAIVVAEQAQAAGIPMNTAIGGANEITLVGEYIFRTCYTNEYQGKVMHSFAKNELQGKNYAIFNEASGDYTSGLGDIIEAEIAATGGNLVIRETYNSDDIDFNAQISKIMEYDPDVIFLPEFYAEAIPIIQQFRAAGYDKSFVGPDGFDGILEGIGANSADIFNNVYFTTHYSPSDVDAGTQDFVNAYKADFNGEEPTAFSALAYDTVNIFAEAIELAKTEDPVAVIEAKKGIDYKGVTGETKFDENRDPVKSVTIIEVKDGAYILNSKIAAD